MKVIRIVQYEGTEEAVRVAISQSLPLGVKQCTGYAVTIAEHLNELPQTIQLSEQEVQHRIKVQQLLSTLEN